MHKASFKQFSRALQAYRQGTELEEGADPVVVEVLGLFKSDEKRAAELLELVKRGDAGAVPKLEALFASLEKKNQLVGNLKEMRRQLEKMKVRMQMAAGSENAKAGPDLWAHVGKNH
jgi:hypothetical protein